MHGRSQDLSALLKDWPAKPGQVNVRVIEGDDGEPKLQMRLDLGVLQMEMSGRPDGQMPHGYESMLEYFEACRDDVELAVGELAENGFTEDAAPNEDEFTLGTDECRQLREEAVQYYHRYVALLVVGDFMGVVRDTSRNLRVLDLCREYAEEDDDRDVLEQFRPYLVMMRTRAMASQMVTDEEPKAALFALELGLNQLREVYDLQGRIEAFEQSHEAQLLQGMRDELMKKLPSSQKAELRARLEEAIAAENYELAAILRDELRMLGES